jgi:hypothetical protein
MNLSVLILTLDEADNLVELLPVPPRSGWLE